MFVFNYCDFSVLYSITPEDCCKSKQKAKIIGSYFVCHGKLYTTWTNDFYRHFSKNTYGNLIVNWFFLLIYISNSAWPARLPSRAKQLLLPSQTMKVNINYPKDRLVRLYCFCCYHIISVNSFYHFEKSYHSQSCSDYWTHSVVFGVKVYQTWK